MCFAFTGCSTRALPFNLPVQRAGRAVRTFLIAVVVAGAVAVAGGQVLEARAADRIANQLASSTTEAHGIDVDLEGFPVAFRAATGRIPRTLIRVERLTTQEPEITFSPVVLELRGLRFDPIDVAARGAGAMSVRAGTASATLPAQELTRIIADAGWEIRSQGDELVASGSVEGVDVRVVVAVEAADGALRLTAREVATGGDVPAGVVARAFDRSVSIPDLPGRLELREAEVTEDGVVLRADVRGTLDLGR